MTAETASRTVLTADQVEQFHRQGFLSLERLTTGVEVAALRVIYDRLFEPGATVEAADRVELAGRRRDGAATLPQILNPERYAPQLLKTSAFRHAHAVARQLLGENAEHMGMHAIRKPARSGAATPLHQDEAYWDPAFDHPAISIWLPLQPATVENGCMRFVPASHLADVVPHELINPGEADGLQATDARLGEGAVACPLPAGGATVHHARTLHYAGPNSTDSPRRALIMGFRTAPQWRGDGRVFAWQPASWYDGPS